MSTRPRPKKQYDPAKHHEQVEKHMLHPRDHIALAQIEASLVAMREAKTHILLRAASNDWNYPNGKGLSFEPNYETGEVTVTMVDVKSVKSTNKEGS